MITSIRTRLLLMFLFVLVFTSSTALFALYEIHQVDKSYQHLVNTRAEISNRSRLIVADFEYSALYLRSYLLINLTEYLQRYQDSLDKTRSSIIELKGLVKDPEDIKLVDNMLKDIDSYVSYSREVIAIKQKSPDIQDVIDYTVSKRGTINSFIQTGNALADYQHSKMKEEKIKNTEKVGSIIRTVIISIISVIVLSILFALFEANAISRPLRVLAAESEKIATGDLTGEDLKTRAHDEVGRLTGAFNYMRGSLNSLVSEVASMASNLSSAVQGLSSSAQMTSVKAEAASGTAAHMSMAVDQVAQSAQKVAAASKDASELAERGNVGISTLTSQMDKLGRITGEVSGVILGLNNSTGEITRIVDIISNIADQTNLLALNAAIEAARAGDSGRGFAVVAEEVRLLAEQSASSAKEIHRLIQEVQSESGKAVSVMGRSKDEFLSGLNMVYQVGDYFKNIIEKVHNLSGQIQDVAAASQQMASSVQNVTEISREQSGAIQEVSALAEELACMAETMEQIAAKFKHK
ncbi:MAG: methyl-accepting chemotaxis protein [Bacillota bacterium]